MTARPLWAAALALAALMLAPMLTAEDRGTIQLFKIPAQPLSSALLVFSEQAGLQILVSSELTETRVSGPVAGRYTPAEALSRLLAPHALRFRYVASKTIAIAHESGDPEDAEPTQPAPRKPDDFLPGTSS